MTSAARSAARSTSGAATAGRHLSAIHVLKAQLGLCDDAYRDLLQSLTGKRSSKAMTDGERQAVRDHLQRLAKSQAPGPARPGRRGALSPEAFAQARAQASPRERKVWALWHALHRAGLVSHADQAALDAWVGRQVQVSALRFCTTAQLDTCIEALKVWLKRAPGAATATTRTET